MGLILRLGGVYETRGDSMFRSVDLMSDLGVSEETQEILRSVLEKSRSILLSK